MGSEIEARDLATPFIPQEKTAGLAEQAARTAHTQALTENLQKMQPHEIAQLLAGNELTKAKTVAQLQEVQDQKDLGDLPREIMQAKLDQMRREGQAYTDFELPNGKVLKNVSSDTIVKAILTKGAGTKGELTDYQRHQISRQGSQDTEKRQSEAEDAEAILLNRKKAKDGGDVNQLDPASQPYADEFNRKSDKPYAYVWGDNFQRNTIWPNKPGLHKVDLPVANINGKPTQLTARLLTQMGQASKPPLTMKQVLEILQRGGTIKDKLPWQ